MTTEKHLDDDDDGEEDGNEDNGILTGCYCRFDTDRLLLQIELHRDSESTTPISSSYGQGFWYILAPFVGFLVSATTTMHLQTSKPSRHSYIHLGPKCCSDATLTKHSDWEELKDGGATAAGGATPIRDEISIRSCQLSNHYF